MKNRLDFSSTGRLGIFHLCKILVLKIKNVDFLNLSVLCGLAQTIDHARMPNYILYLDESGSRHPDKKSDRSREGRDWFALGGVLVKSEDKEIIRAAHREFCGRWDIRKPLHMTDLVNERKGFSWLGKISEERRARFWAEYKHFLSTLPVVGHACVIDRPGYVRRGYLEAHPDRWLLCRSAFDILAERTVKIAIRDGRKLSIVFEGDVGINETIKGYFKNLKEHGLAFDAGRSEKYKPLTPDQFQATLGTIEYKNKDNPFLQIADSFVYSIARYKYDKKFSVYRQLRDKKKIVNFILQNEEIPHMGIKYYCFDK